MVSRKRIPVVVIAEDYSFSESIRYNLFLDGFNVDVAASGPSGLELISANLPQLVLLACSDSAEILEKLKGDPLTRNIPVIEFAEDGRSNEADDVLAPEADEFVSKSIRPEMLGRTVHEKLKKCRKQMKKARNIRRIPVVLIDDDAGLRRLMEYNLSREGFDVHGAADGASGIELVRKIKPKLVLLDIVMPGMDGLEVLSALKYETRTADIPVVMLTSESLIGTIDRAYNIGATGYITKPIRGRKLGSTLKEMLDNSTRKDRR